MKCLSCGAEFSGNAPFCIDCVKNLPVRQPVYDAPAGFSFEGESGFYYRRKETGVVWFDPFTGEYHVVKEDAIPEPVVQVASAPEPDYGYEIEQTEEPIPEDFLLDEDSGCFYREEPDGVRWYDPIMGEYEFRQGPVTLTPESGVPVAEIKLSASESEVPVAETIIPVPVSEMPVSPIPSPVPTAYILPEGFISDPDSGLAWRSQPVEMREGKEVMPVTWFDVQTGEYAQILYFTSQSKSEEILIEKPSITTNPVSMINPNPLRANPPQAILPQAIPQQTYDPGNGKPVARRSRKAGIIIAAAVGVILLCGGLWAIFTGRLADLLPVAGENTENTMAADSPEGSIKDAASSGEIGNDQSAVQENIEEEEVLFVQTWNDAQLEMAARAFLQKPEGEILSEDLADVHVVWIFGNGQVWFSYGDDYERFEYNQYGESGITVKSIDDLTRFPNVERVAFEYVGADDLEGGLSVLHSLPNLHELHFWHVSPSLILSQIPGLTQIDYLFIADCELTDLSFIESMTSLRHVRIQEMAITDLGPLSRLPELEHLDIVDLDATDLTPLRNMPSLTNLFIEHMEITDYSPVARYQTVYIDGEEWTREELEGTQDAMAGKGGQLITDYRFFIDIGLWDSPVDLMDIPYNEIRNFSFVRNEDADTYEGITRLPTTAEDVRFTFLYEDIKYGGGYPLSVAFGIFRLAGEGNYSMEAEEFAALFEAPLYELVYTYEGSSYVTTLYVLCGDYAVTTYFDYDGSCYDVELFRQEDFFELYSGEEYSTRPFTEVITHT